MTRHGPFIILRATDGCTHALRVTMTAGLSESEPGGLETVITTAQGRMIIAASELSEMLAIICNR